MSASKPVILRSAANPTVRRLVRMRDNRARRKAARVIVDGWRETSQAIDAGLTLRGLYLPESLLDAADSDASKATESSSEPLMTAVLNRSRGAEKITWVADAIMEKIGYGQSSRGVVAEFDQPQTRLDELALPPSPLLLVLDRIEKPGNIGALFRCADAAGVDAVLLCESGDIFNPNAIRSSLGCVFHVPSASGSAADLQNFLGQRSIRLLAARVESSTSIWSADLRGPLAILLGSEATGLGDRWRSLAGEAIAGVQIPMSGSIDSLNVSVTGAVILFEAIRQRQLRTPPESDHS